MKYGENVQTPVEATATAGDFAVDATSGTITAGNSLSLNVTFTPSSLGAKTATITVLSDDGDEATYTFGVAGAGVAAPTPGGGTPNAALTTSFTKKIKKLKKQLKKAKSSGNAAKAKKIKKQIKKQIKKFAKKLKAL